MDKDVRKNFGCTVGKLSDGGTPLMLQKYDFSERYGWIKDKYGVTWQLILTNLSGEPRPFIIPSPMFTQDGFGKANEAIDLYTSIFKTQSVARLPVSACDETETSTLMFADFMLEGQWFAAMDGAGEHKFAFQRSHFVTGTVCDTQKRLITTGSSRSTRSRAVRLAGRTAWRLVAGDLGDAAGHYEERRSGQGQSHHAGVFEDEEV